MTERTEFQKAWENIRYPIKVGLREISDVEKKNVHYAGVLLVVIACEALSLLMDLEREDEIFVNELILPHRKLDRAMAEDLWKALRDGLAHIYDTKFIRVDDQLIEIMVSWEDYPHLTRRDDPPGIYLNLQTMRQDLERAFDLHDKEFWLGPLRDLPERWRYEREKKAQDGATPGWRNFLRGGQT